MKNPLNPANLRAMSDDQLALNLKDTMRNLFHLRVQSSKERLETPSQITRARRDIARIKTILHERRLAIAKLETEGLK